MEVNIKLKSYKICVYAQGKPKIKKANAKYIKPSLNLVNISM